MRAPSRRRVAAGGPALFGPLLLLVLGATGCGDGESGGAGAGGDPPALSPEAETGRQLATDRGCAGCHGNDFDGGVGPTWIGVYGSTVELEDAKTVTADDAYLVRAIADPDAEKVAGYSVAMPDNDLTDAEIDQIVAYIRELGEP